MFRDTLLESAPVGRKRKRWPMAFAFTLELLAGAGLIVLPLLYPEIIPFSARVPLIAPRLERPPRGVDESQPKGDRMAEGGGPSTTRTVVDLTAVSDKIISGPPASEAADERQP